MSGKIRVAIIGAVFKENVPDLRNTKVKNLITELKEYGVEIFVHEPLPSAEGFKQCFNFNSTPWELIPEWKT